MSKRKTAPASRKLTAAAISRGVLSPRHAPPDWLLDGADESSEPATAAWLIDGSALHRLSYALTQLLEKYKVPKRLPLDEQIDIVKDRLFFDMLGVSAEERLILAIRALAAKRKKPTAKLLHDITGISTAVINKARLSRLIAKVK